MEGSIFLNKGLWTASLLFLILGLLFLAVGIGCHLYENFKEPIKRRCTARVVALLLEEPKPGEQYRFYKNCYYPVLEYYAEGKLYKIRYPQGSYPSRFKLNQEVKIAYEKGQPEAFVMEKTSSLRLLAQWLYGVGVACLLAACIIFLIFAMRG